MTSILDRFGPLAATLVRVVFAVALAVGIASIFQWSPTGQRLEATSIDVRFAHRGPRPSPSRNEIVVLEIDDVSDSKLQQRWPWSRTFHATALRNLQKAGARAVVFDVQFMDPTPNEGADQELIDAVRDSTRAGTPVVLATAPDPKRCGGLPLPFCGIDEALGQRVGTRFAQSGASLGLGDFRPEGSSHDVIDAVVRDVAIDRTFKLSDGGSEIHSGLARAAIKAAGYTSAPVFEGKRSFTADWNTPRESIRHVNYADIVEGDSNALEAVAGRVVFIGTTSVVLHDEVLIPVERELGDKEAKQRKADSRRSRTLPGIYLHAQSYLNQRDGRELTSPGGRFSLLATAVLALFVAALAYGPLRGHVIRWGLLGVALLGGWIALGFWLFESRSMILPVAAPIAGAGAVLVVLIASTARRALMDRRHVSDVFSRYMAPGVVKGLLASNQLDIRPGGQSREVTVLMSDVRGFTAMSDGVDPGEIVTQLNEYFEEMVAAVDDQEGTVDKFIGDGMMAFFGAPAEQADHAARACACANDMLRRLRSLNNSRVGRGLHPLAIGIGLATGRVIVGNIGSTRRLEYTAIGDTVNLAARLEGATKELGVPIVASSATVAAAAAVDPVDVELGLSPAPPSTNPLGSVQLKGMRDPVAVHAIAAPGSNDAGTSDPGELELPAA